MIGCSDKSRRRIVCVCIISLEKYLFILQMILYIARRRYFMTIISMSKIQKFIMIYFIKITLRLLKNKTSIFVIVITETSM